MLFKYPCVIHLCNNSLWLICVKVAWYLNRGFVPTYRNLGILTWCRRQHQLDSWHKWFFWTIYAGLNMQRQESLICCWRLCPLASTTKNNGISKRAWCKRLKWSVAWNEVPGPVQDLLATGGNKGWASGTKLCEVLNAWCWRSSVPVAWNDVLGKCRDA